MVKKESVTINVPTGMAKYLVTLNPEAELTRNALLLYPYILNQTISHGRAAEILGIMKIKSLKCLILRHFKDFLLLICY